MRHGQVRMWFGKERVLQEFHYPLTPISFPIAIFQVNTALLVVLTTRFYTVSIGEVIDVSKKLSSSMFRVYCRGTQIIGKPGSCSNITVARRVKRSKLHTEGPQILGDIVQNLVTRVLGILNFWSSRGFNTA